jgi:protein farnesyltransferase/geranylgeranyltransferase type-1 subunit alpha
MEKNNNNKDWKVGLNTELLWTATLGGDNPKNYQIWYHRRALLEHYAAAYSSSSNQEEEDKHKEHKEHYHHDHWISITDIGTSELDYIGTVLHVDGKNYHAWSHRQWVVGNIIATTMNSSNSNSSSIWSAEMEYTTRLLEIDVRNNSAWNHRWFALHHGRGQQATNDDIAAAVHDELEFCLVKARLDLHNESPFRYLVALLKEQFKTMQQCDDDPTPQLASLLEEYLDKVANLVDDGTANDNDPLCSSKTTTTTTSSSSSRFISGTLVDLLEYKGDTASLTKAMTLLDDLANSLDPIRCKYWNLRKQQIQQRKTNNSKILTT